MSRNLGSTNCYFCPGDIVPVENKRPITKDDCGYYFDTYSSIEVANCECDTCLAKYLGWFNYPGNPPSDNIIDTSFRSTFNDEPGLDDLPIYEIKTELIRIGPYPVKERYGYLLPK